MTMLDVTSRERGVLESPTPQEPQEEMDERRERMEDPPDERDGVQERWRKRVVGGFTAFTCPFLPPQKTSGAWLECVSDGDYP